MLRKGRKFKNDAEPSWKLLRDDFSVQARSEKDPRFWIRCDTGSNSGVVITDFMPSRFDADTLADALLAVLKTAGRDPLRDGMEFTDLAPGGDLVAARLRAQKIAIVLVPFAERLSSRVEDLDLKKVAGKYRLAVSLMTPESA